MLSITLLRWITLSSILFWFVQYWQGGKKIITDIQNSVRSKNSRLDTILLIVISLCSTGIVSIGVGASLNLLSIVLSQNLLTSCIGMVFSVSGIVGMFYCRSHLGKFWTAETHLSNGHQIIDTGPYHLVRHPIYTFAILMYSGLGMVFLSEWIVVIAIVIIIAYVLKTKEEDHYLEQNLAGYRQYQQHVRNLLLPGVW